VSKLYLPWLDGPPPADEGPKCDHGVTFDEEAAQGLTVHEIRAKWPRLFGECPRGCGYRGIAYASFVHYLSGGW
jgi:hypothetical protein